MLSSSKKLCIHEGLYVCVCVCIIVLYNIDALAGGHLLFPGFLHVACGPELVDARREKADCLFVC